MLVVAGAVWKKRGQQTRASGGVRSRILGHRRYMVAQNGNKIATSRPALYIKVKVKVNFIGVAHFRATLAPSDSFGTALMK